MTVLEPHLCALMFTATHGGGTREARRLQLDAAHGRLVRVHRGVYAMADDWARLDARGRHVVLTRAVTTGLASSCVVSHASAAAVWSLPRVQDVYDDVVTVLDPRRETTRRSTHLLRRPGVAPADPTTPVADVRVTSLARTSVDVARTSSFADAVLCVDAVLRRLTPRRPGRPAEFDEAALAALRDDLSAMVGCGSRPGDRAARRAVAFASPRAENGGESLMRIVLFELGVANVQLQRTVEDDRGFAGRCDAFLADFGVALELDGHVKLTDPVMLRGRSPAEVVRERGRRDRRLLRVPGIRFVVHCEYSDLVFPERLVELLRAAGVTIDPRRVTAAARVARRRFARGTA